MCIRDSTWPDQANRTNSIQALPIPSLLSLLAFNSPSAEVKGLDAFPADDIPPVLSLIHILADGVLHPAVGEDDPQGGQVRGDGHEPDRGQVDLLAHALPAERPHRKEMCIRDRCVAMNMIPPPATLTAASPPAPLLKICPKIGSVPSAALPSRTFPLPKIAARLNA